MSFSAFLENKILQHVFGGTAYASPTTLYVALWTDASTPSDNTPGTEVTTSGTGYARVAITLSTGMIVSGSSPTQVVNASTLTWSAATANWGNVKYAALYDAASGGNVLEWGTLTATKNVTTGDIYQFPAGGYKITLN